MARKIRAREVLRLLESGMSRNAIARSQGMSKHSVQAVSEAAEAAGIGWAEAEGMSDAEVYAALFPEKVRDRDVYPDPDWECVHRELARVGVRSSGCTGSTATSRGRGASPSCPTTASASATASSR